MTSKPCGTGSVKPVFCAAIFLSLVACFLPDVVFGAEFPSFIQERDNRVSSGKVVTVATASPTTVGNLIVIYVVWDNTGAVSLADSAGNSYVSAAGPTKWDGGRYTAQTFYAKNVKGGADTVTATFGTTIRSFGGIYVIEYAGLDQAAPFDASAAAIGSSGSLNSGSVTTTSASDLLFAAGVSATSVTTPGAGYIARATSHGDLIMDKNVSTQGVYNATAGNGGGVWAMQVVAFKAASATPSDTVSPTIPAGLSATVVSATQINLGWTAATDNVGVTGYLVERSQGLGSTAFAQIGTPAGPTFNDLGLSAGTVYNYRVRATDAVGNLSGYSSVASVTTASLPDATPPTVPTGLSATAVSASQINLGWTAATDNVGVTGYLVERSQGLGSTAFAQIGTPAGPTFNDLGLSAGTIYNYRVRATDAVGNLSGYSSVASVTTASLPDATPPVFVQERDNRVSSGKVVTVATASPTTVGNLIVIYVVWDNTGAVSLADSAGNSYVSAAGPTKWDGGRYTAQTFYAKNVKGGADTVTATFGTTIRSFGGIYVIEYAGLDQAAPFDASAAAIGSSGSLNSGSVTTTSASDLLFAAGVSATSVTTPGAGYIARATSHGDLIMDKNVSTQGVYNATAGNGGGVWAMQVVAFKAASATPSDTVSPTIPAGLSATVVSATQINLGWTAATDNVGVTGYLVERSQGLGSTAFAQIGTPAGPTFNDLGLSAGTVYNYRVRATDAVGNLSGYSSVASVTTASLPDATPPTVPTGLSATAVSASQINLGWTAATDNVGVTGYLVERSQGLGSTAFAQIGTPAGPTFNDLGLSAGTIYNYRVRATDAVGNLSGYSSVASVTTPSAPDTVSPSVPTGLSATAVSASQINLGWTAATDNVGVTGYRIYRNGVQIATTATTAYADTGLASGATCTYAAAAFDAAGNVSAQSATASATTLSVALPVVSSFGADPAAITAGQVTTLSWVVSNSASITVNQGVGKVTGTGYAILNPTATTVYTLTATNSAGSATAQITVTVSPDTQAPTAPNNLAATAVSSSQASLAWSASFDNIGVVGYQVYRNGVVIGTTNITTYLDTGLAAGTTYIYAIAALDAAGNLSTMSAGMDTTTFALSPGNYVTTFPLTENPISEGGNWINGGTVGLDWANVAVTNGLAHGTESGVSQNGYDDSTAILAGNWGSNQMASATVFRTGANYQYEEVEIRLRSTITPHSCTGYEVLFSAYAPGGYATIVRWNGALGDFTYINQNPNSNYHGISNGDVVSASVSNNVIIGYVNGVEVIRGTDSTWTSGNPGMGFWLQGSPPSRVLDYGFTSFTASDGTVTGSGTTTNTPDALPPSVPTNLQTSEITQTAVTISWTISTDNVGVTGYLVERSQGLGSTAFAQIGTPAGPTFNDLGLSAGTVYNYRVRATDAVGNLSGYSSVASVTTASLPDATPPTVPTGLSATAVSASQINLGWTAATDNVGVTGYRIYRNGVQIATATTTAYADTGLLPSTLYTYAVSAYDLSGNNSAQSASISVTTLAQTGPAWKHVQTNAKNSGAALNALSFPSANVVGNLIIAEVDWTGSPSFVSISDSQGNVYAQIGTEQNASNVGVKSRLYYAKNIKSGANTVTSVISGAASYHELYIHEYSGLDMTNPLDAFSVNAATGKTFTSGTLTTTVNNELLYGLEIDTSSASAAAGWTIRSAFDGNTVADKIATSAGSYSFTGNSSGAFLVWLAAFK